jgi:hypothetical protein
MTYYLIALGQGRKNADCSVQVAGQGTSTRTRRVTLGYRLQ